MFPQQQSAVDILKQQQQPRQSTLTLGGSLDNPFTGFKDGQGLASFGDDGQQTIYPYSRNGLSSNSPISSFSAGQEISPGSNGVTLGASTYQSSQQRAQAAAAAEAARVRSQNVSKINTAGDRITSAGKDAFTSFFNQYNTGARGLVDNVRTGQENIDRSRQNIELDKLNSLSGLSSQIRQGIQSGNIRLAAGNAADSSGAEQLARAYQQIGTQQGNTIFNEAALGNRDVDFDQSALDLQESEGLRQLDVYKDEEKNRIGSDVENKLLALDEQAIGLGLDGQVQVKQLKQQVIDEGIARLVEIDNYLKQQFAGMAPQSQGQIQAEAQKLRTQGRPEGGFNFGDLQQTGPANTGFELPLLGARRNDER